MSLVLRGSNVALAYITSVGPLNPTPGTLLGVALGAYIYTWVGQVRETASK